MEKDEKLNELATDFFTIMFEKPKRKKLRPLVKQITYKGITKKWAEDGEGNFLDFIGKPRYAYYILVKEGESNIEFVKRLIDENYFD